MYLRLFSRWIQRLTGEVFGISMEGDDDGVDHEVVCRHLLSRFRAADEFATRVVSFLVFRQDVIPGM